MCDTCGQHDPNQPAVTPTPVEPTVVPPVQSDQPSAPLVEPVSPSPVEPAVPPAEKAPAMPEPIPPEQETPSA